VDLRMAASLADGTPLELRGPALAFALAPGEGRTVELVLLIPYGGAPGPAKIRLLTPDGRDQAEARAPLPDYRKRR
jgi:hypothetical protein